MAELDELQTFLIERLQAYDPTIDTSPGSSADSNIIQPTLSRLGPDPYETPILDFLLRRAETEFPNLVLQKGEPIYDLVLNFARMAHTPFRRQINLIGRNQSVANPEQLNEQEADRLMANFFAPRQEGKFAIGTARLFFTQPRFVNINPTNACFTGSGLRFFPVESQSITAERMLFNLSGSLYFFDIMVRAEEQGADYNIDASTLVGIENLPSAVKVTNLAKFEEGDNRETTAEYFSRVEQSLAERSLVVPRGIRARLFSIFNTVTSVSVIGMGDIEMNRDLVTGGPNSAYAFGMMTSNSGASTISIAPGSNFTDGIFGHTDFASAGVAVGDTFSYLDLTNQQIRSYSVLKVDPFSVQVTPTPPTLSAPAPFWVSSPNRGSLTISDIPGGILDPQTPQGEIVIDNRQVHIGGKYDVFVRAGSPQESTFNVQSLSDAEPLYLGVDLESFGGDPAEFVQLTPPITQAMTTDAAYTAPADTVAQLLVRLDSAVGTTPWLPTSDDVGTRYVELLGPDYGLFAITNILEDSTIGGVPVRRIEVSLQNQHTGTLTGAVTDRSSVFDLGFRLVESVSVAPRVRDRAVPVAQFSSPAAGGSVQVDAEVGDSVVLETSTDAGIYTVRRRATSITQDDTLILDRDLSATVTPSGTGNGTGIRYRIDDEIQLDIINPRIPKIPLGTTFPGGDLGTVANSQTVSSTSTNFLLAGVAVGDTLEVTEEPAVGVYEITNVAATTLTVSPPMPATGFNLDFEVYRSYEGAERPIVRVKSVELLDSSNQPTGITVPFGDAVDVRALSSFGNRNQGNLVESFRGGVVSASPMTTFEDVTVDFVQQGVTPGDRLEILEGDNSGEYEVVGVTANRLTTVSSADGGVEFVGTDTGLHYIVGLPSTGTARVYFQEPTTVEFDTGIAGGRLAYVGGAQPVGFRFSDTDGYTILPEVGSTSGDPRDLRVLRSFEVVPGTSYQSIVELTSNDVYDLELLEGDVLEVNEQIQFTNSAGTDFQTLGVFGTPAGLRTVSGSSRVSVPPNSLIDFTQMGDLSGQVVIIETGPDAGTYSVEQVIDSKTLELNTVMTSTTETTLGADIGTSRDGSTILDTGNYYLVDATDSGQFPAVGEYITIFEATNPALEGTYQVAALDLPANRVQLSGLTTASAGATFSWVATGSNTLSGTLEQGFKVYNTTPTEVIVEQVATVAPDITGLQSGNISGTPPLDTITGVPGDFTGVSRGDRLEIPHGPNAGVYPVLSATTSTVTIYNQNPFASAEVGVEYRVRGGMHGGRTLLTVGGYRGSSGLLSQSIGAPYKIRRPNVYRLPSTAMESNVEGGLYYADIAVESTGPGDDRNLERLTRMVLQTGYRVDGYTYSVGNNTLTFSPYEEVSLNFDRRLLPAGNSDLPTNRTEIGGRNVQVTYEHSPIAATINSFMRSDSDRVLTADPIVRHFLPSYLYAQFVYAGGSSTAVVGPDMEDYINGLGALDELEVSDLEAFITRRGANSVRHPITLVTITHDIDRNLVAERSENSVGGVDAPYNGTGRISTYFASIGEGLTLVRQ